jgi:hypothetical protein
LKIAVTSKSISLPGVIISMPLFLVSRFTDILLLIGQLGLPTPPSHLPFSGHIRQRHGVRLLLFCCCRVQSWERFLLSISPRGSRGGAFRRVALLASRHDVLTPCDVSEYIKHRAEPRRPNALAPVAGPHCEPCALDLDLSCRTAVECPVQGEIR